MFINNNLFGIKYKIWLISRINETQYYIGTIYKYIICFLIFIRSDSIEKLKHRLPVIEKELSEPSKFKDFYYFTFNYAKNIGQKGLDLDMAITYWNIIFVGRFRFLDLWCQFLRVSILNKKLKLHNYNL